MISIIIPLYNKSKYLHECISSLLEQTYKDFEIIIIDDCSTDNSLLIARTIEKENKNIRVLKNNKNLGVSATRNIGIRNSIGEYIFPLDADDKISPDCLELMIKEIQKGKFDIISGQTRFFGKVNNIIPVQSYNFINLLKGNNFQCSALYYKKHWEEVGGYKEDRINGYEDWEFWINMGKHKHYIYQIPKVLFYYRKIDDSRYLQSARNHKRCVEYIKKVHKDVYENNPTIKKTINKSNVVMANVFNFRRKK